MDLPLEVIYLPFSTSFGTVASLISSHGMSISSFLDSIIVADSIATESVDIYCY